MQQSGKDPASSPSSVDDSRDSTGADSAEAALKVLHIAAASQGDGSDEGNRPVESSSSSVEAETCSARLDPLALLRSSSPIPAHESMTVNQSTMMNSRTSLAPSAMTDRSSLPLRGNRFEAQQRVRDIGAANSTPKHTKLYRKKNPLFFKEHKARSRSATEQKLKAIVNQLKTTFRHHFPGSFRGIDEVLSYKTKLAHKLQDPRSDDELQLDYLRNIIRRSNAQQKQVLRPESRRHLKEQDRLQRDNKLRERKVRGIVGRQPLPSSLEEEQEIKVAETLRRHGKIAQMPGAGVEAHDIVKLTPRQWLNDEVINFYMKLIERRSNTAAQKREEAAEARKQFRLTKAACQEEDEADKEKLLAARELAMNLARDVEKRWNGMWNVHVFNTFFFEKLSGKQGYAGVRQWTRKVDIFTKDLILLPINVGQMHWTCAAINMRKCRFEYYDSMHSRNQRVFATLAAYLMDEYTDKKKGEFGKLDLRGWEHYFSRQSPAQSNGYDCGVFATMTIEQLSRRSPWDGPLPPRLDAKTVVMQSAERAARLSSPVSSAHDDESNRSIESGQGNSNDETDEELWNFSQDDMNYLRRRMIYEIVTTDLLD